MYRHTGLKCDLVKRRLHIACCFVRLSIQLILILNCVFPAKRCSNQWEQRESGRQKQVLTHTITRSLSSPLPFPYSSFTTVTSSNYLISSPVTLWWMIIYFEGKGFVKPVLDCTCANVEAVDSAGPISTFVPQAGSSSWLNTSGGLNTLTTGSTKAI